MSSLAMQRPLSFSARLGRGLPSLRARTPSELMPPVAADLAHLFGRRLTVTCLLGLPRLIYTSSPMCLDTTISERL